MKEFNEKYNTRRFVNKNEFAETYVAINSITKDKVILKIFNEKINKEEVKLLKNLENPNLININDFGSFVENETERYYVEVEDFHSKSLSEILEMNTLTSVEAVKILKQVAEGLKEFHFKGLVFGNLSCDSVYMNNAGVVKIDTLSYLDRAEEEENLTEEDDIYSLGAILFELVTGKNNFKPEKSKHYISDKDLLLIINRCSNDRYNKYEDLNKFIEDLNAYIEYGGTTSINEEYEDYDEFEDDENERKFSFIKIIRNIVVCALVVVLIGIGVNASGLLNKKEPVTKAPVTKVEEEKTKEEVAEKPDEDSEKEDEEIIDNKDEEEEEENKNTTTVTRPTVDTDQTTTKSNTSNSTTTRPSSTTNDSTISNSDSNNTTSSNTNDSTTSNDSSSETENNTESSTEENTNNESTENQTSESTVEINDEE